MEGESDQPRGRPPITQPVTRRTQHERSSGTRRALVDAAVEVIHAEGYSAASTALIADRAGVSRGAILHHFGTRAALMAEVVGNVYRREQAQYGAILAGGEVGHRVGDWPVILWDVLGQPSGIAVLEILQATRSDPELAGEVRAMQIAVENEALAMMRSDVGGGKDEALALMRLMVWAIRGLSMADRLMPDHDATRAAVDLLARLIRNAAPSGRVDEVFADPSRGGDARVTKL